MTINCTTGGFSYLLIELPSLPLSLTQCALRGYTLILLHFTGHLLNVIPFNIPHYPSLSLAAHPSLSSWKLSLSVPLALCVRK